MASARGNVDSVRCLTDAKCDVDDQDKYGNTALHLAIRRKYSNVAMVLLHSGADFDISNCVSRFGIIDANKIKSIILNGLSFSDIILCWHLLLLISLVAHIGIFKYGR